jgi:cell division protein FtsL
VTPAAAAAPAVRPAGRRSAGATGHRRPLAAPPRPRRVSGPLARPHRDLATRPRAEDHDGIALGLIAALGRLSEHRLLDRLIRGRSWIAIVAFALIGIVTMQLVLLKLNAGVGRSLVSEAALQRENAALSIENSELAAGGRVESSAVRLSMEVVPMGALRFLTTNPQADLRHGAEALNTPVSSATTEAAEPSSGTSASANSSSTSSTSAEAASTAPGTSTTAAQTSAPSSEAAPAPSGESAGTSASTPPSGEAATTTAPQAAGASGGPPGEASPAGGTQAGSSG